MFPNKIIQIIIGLLFLSSGLLKAVDSQEFASLITSYGFKGGSFIAPVISGLEIVLGLCFVLNIYIRNVSAVALVLTVLFTLLFGYAFFFRGIEDCGCMGSFIKIPPYVSFIRNILIIISCYWLFRIPREEDSSIVLWKKGVLYTVACLSFCLAGYTSGKSIIEKNHLKEGENIQNTALRFFDQLAIHDKSFVFIFSPECTHCWNSTENIKSIKNIPEFNNVLGVTFQSRDLTGYIQEMQPNFEVVNYPTAELGEVILEVPVLVVIEKGVIVRIFKSDEIPCGPLLKKMMGNR